MRVGILTGATANVFPHLSCPAKLFFQTVSYACNTLIDSGAEQNFLDETLAQKLGLPLVSLPETLQVSALNGSHLASITHRTQDITLILSGNHSEKVSLFLFKAPDTPLVLGFPWLQLHNPHIDWARGCLSGWSTRCRERYLLSAVPDSSATGSVKPSPPLTYPQFCPSTMT